MWSSHSFLIAIFNSTAGSALTAMSMPAEVGGGCGSCANAAEPSKDAAKTAIRLICAFMALPPRCYVHGRPCHFELDAEPVKRFPGSVGRQKPHGNLFAQFASNGLIRFRTVQEAAWKRQRNAKLGFPIVRLWQSRQRARCPFGRRPRTRSAP